MDSKSRVGSIVQILKNGPVLIKGDFVITGADGERLNVDSEQAKNGVALCRCGKSNNKPFCDGSHLK